MDSKSLSKLINGMSSDFDIVKTRIKTCSFDGLEFEKHQAIEMVQAFAHTVTVLTAYKLITEKQVNEITEYMQAEMNEITEIVERKVNTKVGTESEVN